MSRGAGQVLCAGGGGTASPKVGTSSLVSDWGALRLREGAGPAWGQQRVTLVLRPDSPQHMAQVACLPHASRLSPGTGLAALYFPLGG